MNEAVKFEEDAYSRELFYKIREQNIKIDPVVWSLLNHVLGNKIYSINLIIGDCLTTPKWIFSFGIKVMKFLYLISGHKGDIGRVDDDMRGILRNASVISDFLQKLRGETEKKAGF